MITKTFANVAISVWLTVVVASGALSGCGEEPGPIGVNAENRDSQSDTGGGSAALAYGDPSSQYPAMDAMISICRHLTAWHDCERETITLTITEDGTVSDQFGNSYPLPKQKWDAYMKMLRDPSKENQSLTPTKYPDGLGTLRKLAYEFDAINDDTIRATCLGRYDSEKGGVVPP